MRLSRTVIQLLASWFGMDAQRCFSCAIAIATVCASTPTVNSQQIFLDDFEDGSLTNDLPLDNDGNAVVWQSIAPPNNNGTASVQSGALRLETPDGGGSMVLYVPHAPLADVSVRTLVQQGGATGATSVVARGDVVALNAYQGGFSTTSGNLYIGRNDNGNPTTLIRTPADFDSENDINLQFDVLGSTLSLYAWPAGTDRPLEPSLTFEDSLYTQGVAAVLLDNNGPGWAAFDFVSVNAIPEPSSASLFAVGILGLLRRRRKSR